MEPLDPTLTPRGALGSHRQGSIAAASLQRLLLSRRLAVRCGCHMSAGFSCAERSNLNTVGVDLVLVGACLRLGLGCGASSPLCASAADLVGAWGGGEGIRGGEGAGRAGEWFNWGRPTVVRLFSPFRVSRVIVAALGRRDGDSRGRPVGGEARGARA